MECHQKKQLQIIEFQKEKEGRKKKAYLKIMAENFTNLGRFEIQVHEAHR